MLIFIKVTRLKLFQCCTSRMQSTLRMRLCDNITGKTAWNCSLTDSKNSKIRMLVLCILQSHLVHEAEEELCLIVYVCLFQNYYYYYYLRVYNKRRQLFYTKCITKDCHAISCVFNMLQCNMALIWWQKMCFMLTVYICYDEMFYTKLFKKLVLYKSLMGHCCAGVGHQVYKIRQSSKFRNICQIPNMWTSLYIMKETSWTHTW